MNHDTVARHRATQPPEPEPETRSPDRVSGDEPEQSPLGAMVAEAKLPCRGCKLALPLNLSPCPSCGYEERPLRGKPYPAKTIDRFFWARDQQIPNATAKAVLNALIVYDMPGGTGIFPSQWTLADDTGYKLRAVQRALAWLEDAKWIERSKGARTRWGPGCDSYRVRQPPHVS